jgi:hypothetical protein
MQAFRMIALGLAVFAAAPVQARDEDPRRAAAFQAVLDCRAMTDTAARLACYDTASARLGEAEAKGDIVVIDRAQASKAHRETFGLPIPSLGFIARALRPDEVDRVDGVVQTARADLNGNWTLVLQDGAVWRQISGQLIRPPKGGAKVSVRRGALGSYLMNVDGQPAIKVHRDQ